MRVLVQLVLVLFVIGFSCQLVHSQQEVTVNTNCGNIVGKYNNGHQVFEYLGIPYAAAPVGSLRWQPTKSLEEVNQCWNGTYEASHFQSMCPQFTSIGLVGSEDCLFLNIWSAIPPHDSHAPLPVMVYIHGGGLIMGSGDQPTYTPWRFAKDGRVISVSINYRLSALGFLALNALSSNDVRGVSGNYGLLDQIQALKWVQQNIAAFGGDPTRVTIWGQSSGGTSVIALLMSPLASGLFHRAITMSGSPWIAASLQDAEQAHSDDWLKNTKCYGYLHLHRMLLDCLYSLSTEEVLQAVEMNAWSPSWLFGLPSPGDYISPLPVIDGYVLPFNMTIALENAVIDVPVMFGVMHEEPDLAPVNIVFDYSTEEYIQFILNSFQPFGEDFGAKVLDTYPIENFDSPQQHYDVVSADVGVVCGNLFLAQQAAKSYQSQLYVYIATRFPQEKPKCEDEGNGYCPHYSYHTWDLVTAADDFGYLNQLSIQDREWGNQIRNHFIEFAQYGNVTNWVPFNESPKYPEEYYVTNLKIGETIWKNAKQSECSFWHDQGFDWRWWQN